MACHLLPPPRPFPLFLNSFFHRSDSEVSATGVLLTPQPSDPSLGAFSSRPHPKGRAGVQTHPLFQKPPQRGSFLAGTFPRKMICLLDDAPDGQAGAHGFPPRGFTKALPILYQSPLCHWPVSLYNPLSVSIILSVSQILFHFSQLHLGLRPSEACQGDP